MDFNTYNKIINEAKEDRVARRAAKAATIEGENLGAQIDGVLSVIGSRLSDPTKAKFKSLAMKDQFMSIATNLSQVQTELAVDDKELKNVNFGEINKQISNLKTLFDDKKKSFESTYAEEEKNTRSFKTLEVATPEVTKFLSDGDIQFGQLSILAQKAANLAAEEAKKPQAATGGTGSTGATGATGATGSIGAKVESAAVKKAEVPKGKRNDEVKKFQEGVIAKYAKDKRISATDPYKKLKQSLDSGQGGYFGPRTDSMVKMLKAGFKLSDTSSDITKELLDKINAQAIKESRLLEQDFDYDAAEKFASGSSSSTGGEKKESPGKKAAEPGAKNDIPAAKEENVMQDKEIKTPIDASKIEKATKELLLAMTGAYEDEDRVYDVFQKSITTKDEFEALRQSWNSMKILPEDLQKAESVWKSYTVAQLAERNKGRKKLVTLQLLFKNSFNNDEINRLNSYLPDGVKKI